MQPDNQLPARFGVVRRGKRIDVAAGDSAIVDGLEDVLSRHCKPGARTSVALQLREEPRRDRTFDVTDQVADAQDEVPATLAGWLRRGLPQGRLRQRQET